MIRITQNLSSMAESNDSSIDRIGLIVAGPWNAVRTIAENTHQAPTRLSPRRTVCFEIRIESKQTNKNRLIYLLRAKFRGSFWFVRRHLNWWQRSEARWRSARWCLNRNAKHLHQIEKRETIQGFQISIKSLADKQSRNKWSTSDQFYLQPLDKFCSLK